MWSWQKEHFHSWPLTFLTHQFELKDPNLILVMLHICWVIWYLNSDLSTLTDLKYKVSICMSPILTSPYLRAFDDIKFLTFLWPPLRSSDLKHNLCEIMERRCYGHVREMYNVHHLWIQLAGLLITVPIPPHRYASPAVSPATSLLADLLLFL